MRKVWLLTKIYLELTTTRLQTMSVDDAMIT